MGRSPNRCASYACGTYRDHDRRRDLASLPDVSHVPVCGGGRLNMHVLELLKRALHARGRRQCVVEPTEYWGVDGDAIEAAAFAWLAYRRVYLLPGNLTQATGAEGPRVLGAVYPG